MKEAIKAQRPDDQVFYAAFKASPIGIAVEDMEGQPLFVNQALCSMLGFSEDELRHKHCVEFSPPEDAKQDWALFEQLKAGLIDKYHLEKRFFRRDGSLIWGRLSISLLKDREFPLVVAMVEDITDKRATTEELLQSEVNLQQLAGRLIQAPEEERKRIARELHDDINQRLGLLGLKLDLLKRALPVKAVELRREMEGARKLVEDLGSDVQALAHRLHPARLEYLGLVPVAVSFCRELSQRQETEIAFHSENIPEQLPSDVSLCLFRVLQEALSNATKHSGSRHFGVSLSGGASEIRLLVRDSGIGFDPMDAATRGDGMGLTSMKERLRFLGGDLTVESKLHHGTTIYARVPLNAVSQAARDRR
jgi:PAS domain S-box-containing protein